MTLHEYAAALARHWVVILVAALVGGGAAFLYSRSLDPLYRASASVIAIPERGENASDLVQGSLYVQNLVQSYAVLGSSPYVLDKAAVALGRDPATSRLAQQVNVDTPLNTVVIEISVVDGNPQLAKDAANAIAAELGKAVEQLSPQGTNQTPAVRLTTISPAALPAAPISPNTKLNTALGLLAGLALGVLYAVGRSLFGKRVVDRDSVMEDLQTPLLGEVFQADRGLDVPTSIALQPTGSVAESFRVLTANLGLAHVDGPLKVVLVTSGSPGEGKSSVSVGLAMTLAESEDRVLVLDGDLRMPSVARLTQLEGAVGVTSVLLGDVTMSEAAQQWGPPRLDIMASGQIPPNRPRPRVGPVPDAPRPGPSRIQLHRHRLPAGPAPQRRPVAGPSRRRHHRRRPGRRVDHEGPGGHAQAGREHPNPGRRSGAQRRRAGRAQRLLRGVGPRRPLPARRPRTTGPVERGFVVLTVRVR